MQSVSSRIWTCVAVSISYDDNHYTTGISIKINLIPKHIHLKTVNIQLKLKSSVGTFEAWRKSILTEAVFTTTEINNEWNVNFSFLICTFGIRLNYSRMFKFWLKCLLKLFDMVWSGAIILLLMSILKWIQHSNSNKFLLPKYAYMAV